MKRKNHLLIFSIAAVMVVVLLIAIIALFTYTRMDHIPVQKQVPQPPDSAYNIPLHRMKVVYGTVEKNQNLSSILSPYLSQAFIDRIAKSSSEVFDVRKIKAGNRFARIIPVDSMEHTLCFVYEINPVEFVVFDFRDSFRIYKDKKQVVFQVKTAEGTITSSLWNCFVENGLDVGLAMALSDVYAWNVDFYGLQKGDNFTVVYEEVYVEDKMVGIDRILAARFGSSGKDFYAFNFEQNGKREYFDEKGQSLQRSFLKAPLKFSRISSRFSKSRMHPILRIARPHFGVDYSAPKGTPVVALGDGRVGEAGWKGGYGRFVSIRHNSVYTSTYAHLSGYAKGITSGAHVSQGQVIGYVGSSGLSTGPHLDFRVYKNGKPVDPLRIESPPTKPVEPVNMQKFLKLVAQWKDKLSRSTS